MLTPEEGRVAVDLARDAIERAVRGERIALYDLPVIFQEKRGVFVTITQRKDLRGCIGLPYPTTPLGEAIIEAAVSAALEDPRFAPISLRELPDIEVEVTVLTEPQPLDCPSEKRPNCIEVGTHGLIVSGFGRSGLLLPQVPMELGWTSTEFLEQACNKARLPARCWMRDDVTVQTFEGQIFGRDGWSE